jgi:hypothetical protein
MNQFCDFVLSTTTYLSPNLSAQQFVELLAVAELPEERLWKAIDVGSEQELEALRGALRSADLYFGRWVEMYASEGACRWVKDLDARSELLGEFRLAWWFGARKRWDPQIGGLQNGLQKFVNGVLKKVYKAWRRGRRQAWRVGRRELQSLPMDLADARGEDSPAAPELRAEEALFKQYEQDHPDEAQLLRSYFPNLRGRDVARARARLAEARGVKPDKLRQQISRLRKQLRKLAEQRHRATSLSGKS